MISSTMTPVQTILQFIGTKELSPLGDYIRVNILPLEEKMLGDCWEAALRRSVYELDDSGLLDIINNPNEPADKETYISNVLNNKK